MLRCGMRSATIAGRACHIRAHAIRVACAAYWPINWTTAQLRTKPDKLLTNQATEPGSQAVADIAVPLWRARASLAAARHACMAAGIISTQACNPRLALLTRRPGMLAPPTIAERHGRRTCRRPVALDTYPNYNQGSHILAFTRLGYALGPPKGQPTGRPGPKQAIPFLWPARLGNQPGQPKNLKGMQRCRLRPASRPTHTRLPYPHVHQVNNC
jgi:hypothetical protein